MDGGTNLNINKTQKQTKNSKKRITSSFSHHSMQDNAKRPKLYSDDTDDDTDDEYGDTEEEDSMNDDDMVDYEEYEEHETVDGLSMEEITTAQPSLQATTVKQNSISSNEIVPEKHWKMVKSDGCKDKFKNCNMVVQSRLCKYSFYQTNCCRSCMLITQP
jgi:hypothetical protein